MGVFSAELADVQRQRRRPGKSRPELLRQLRIEIPHLFRGDLQFTGEMAAAGKIHRGQDQRLVHGQQHIAVADDTLFIAQSPPEGLAQADADILGGMVVIHPRIPVTGHGQVKAAVPRKQREHMVQKAAAGVDFRRAAAIQTERQGDIRLRGGSVDRGRSHLAASHSFLTVAIKVSICSRVPMVIRLYWHSEGLSK